MTVDARYGGFVDVHTGPGLKPTVHHARQAHRKLEAAKTKRAPLPEQFLDGYDTELVITVSAGA